MKMSMTRHQEFKMNHFYLFALQWNVLEQRHTIHGLWPQFTDHRWPEYCSIKQFDMEAIQPLVPTLEIIWPSIQMNENLELQFDFEMDGECIANAYSNENFWKHEWMRHGTCNYNNLDEFQYFAKVIELYNEYDYTYKCHAHLPCLVKFDAFFNLVDSDSFTITNTPFEPVPECICDCEDTFYLAYVQGITHACLAITIACLSALLYLKR